MGLIDSGNNFFSITGSNENPTVTAIYLVSNIPLIVKRFRYNNHQGFYALLLITSIISVITLKCRTAYIGLFVEIIVWLLLQTRNLRKQKISYCKWLILPTFFIVGIIASVKLYDMKRDSSDSRLLIWRLSTKMIIEKPQGYGYGLFERNYNIYQSEYFRTTKASIKEKQNANFTAMAYNDYLEQGVEGGIIGMLFLLGFYILLFITAFHKHDVQALCVVSSLAIMSLTNFIYSSMQPWWLLMCYASFLTRSETYYKIQRNYYICVNSIAISLLFFAIIRIVYMTSSQIQLTKYQECLNKGNIIPKEKLAILQSSIRTSEAYWNLCAYNSIIEQKYCDAIIHLNKAHLFTSSPQDYIMYYIAYQQMQKEMVGIRYIDTLAYMQPSLLRPKLLLMEYYNNIGNKHEALNYAEEILETKPKVNNNESSYIQSKAFNYINSNKQSKYDKIQ